MNRFYPIWLPLVACVLACQAPTEPAPEPLNAADTGEVHPMVVAEYDDDQTRVTIRFDTETLELGAYQGTFNFDAKVLSLVDFSVPADGYRLANTLDAASGRIRFAGFSTKTFESPVVLTLVFNNLAAVGPGTLLSVDIDVLGNPQSQAVPSAMIHAPVRQFARVVLP